MGIFQSGKVVFYHPCNDKTEHTQTQDWTEATPTYLAGKVSNALAPTTGTAAGAFGAASDFYTGGQANDLAIATIDGSTFIVAYQQGGTYGVAKVGTLSGTDITWGPGHNFLAANKASSPALLVLSATKFVVAYRDESDANHGTAKVGTVSGTDITFGAETEFLSSGTYSPVMAKLTVSKFVISYNDQVDSFHNKSRVGTVTGTDITFGAQVEYLAAYGTYASLVAFDASTVVVAYNDAGDSSHGTAKVGTVSGTDITWGAESEFLSAGAASELHAAPIDSTRFVVVYRDGADSNKGTAKVGTVSGTDITWGAEAEFTTGGATRPKAASFGSTAFGVTYKDDADSNLGTAKVGTVSGTTITFGAETEFTSVGDIQYVVPAAAGSALVVAYRDGTDSDHGKATAGVVPSSSSLANSSGLGDFGAEKEYLSSSQQPLAGIARLTATTFAVCYSSTTTGLARVGTVSGTDITFGAESIFEPAGAAAMDPMDAAALSSTKVVVVYMANSPAARNVRAGTVSGTDITWGAATSYFGSSTNRNAITALDSDKFVIGYKRDSTTSGQAKVGTVSGADVTLGPAGNWGSSGNINDYFDLVTLDSTRVVVLYHNDLGGGDYSARVGTVSGADITFATATVFRSSTGTGGAYIAGDALSSGSFLVAYRDVIDSNHGTAKVGTVTGTDITFGAEAEFSTDNTTNIGVAALSATLAAVVYRKDTSGDCEAKIATVSGTAIAFGGEVAFLTGGDTNVGSRTAALDSSTFVVSYRDNTDSNHGTAKASGYNADPYLTVASGTKVAFCGWLRNPSG